ncbi:MAG: hypothetical protein AAFR65_10370 [Pseudomonadota bacterium]
MALGLGLSLGAHGIIPDVSAPTIVPATTGMTTDATWTVAAGQQTSLASSTVASVKILGTFAPSDTGMILEQGASMSGLVVYVFGGTLYFQCGSGASAGPDTSRAFIQHTLASTTELIEFSASASNGRAALYVDGLLVGTDTFSASTLAGSDVGGVGRVYSGAAANFGGWTSDGSGVFSGTIDSAEIYLGEVTADVSS